MHRPTRWLVGGLIGSLASIGIGAAVSFPFREPYNPGFLDFPFLTGLHMTLGAVYLTLAPFQFVRRLRARHLGYHRWAGRMLVMIGVVIGLTALFLGLVIPAWGPVEQAVVGLFGSLFLVAIVNSFVHARAGRIALHREWMIRAFAIGLAIATQRVLVIPVLVAIGGPAAEQFATVSVVGLTVAFVTHTGLAELWIRRTRRAARPSAATATARIPGGRQDGPRTWLPADDAGGH